MTRPARQLRSSLLLVAVLGILTGCDGGAATAVRAGAAPLPAVLRNDHAGTPAPAAAGARPGGTVTVLVDNRIEHLDPARTYIAAAQITNLLLQRTLTTYRHLSDGRLELVGDLATNTGTSADGGRRWTYTLRDGLVFEDGTPITSRDIAYGIARSFDPSLPDGPTHLQQWLADSPDFSKNYRGPYNGGSLLPPGVSTPDARTLVLRFARPRADVPFAVSLGTTTPVPRARDTRGAYDLHPVATGPYRIESYRPGTRLVLSRNPHWRPDTDPIRTAYPDGFAFVFGQSPTAATGRILAGHDADRSSVSLEQVPSPMLMRVAEDAALARRTVVGTTPYVFYLKINTARVTDVRVRQALNCAFDRDGYIRVLGGRGVAEPASTILPRLVAGFRDYNAYDCGPSGDPQRAAGMLGGRRVPLRYGYRDNTSLGQRIARFMSDSLGRAGFDLTPVPVDGSRYYSATHDRDNGLDIFLAAWGADWPTGEAVIRPLMDGRTIRAHGNLNTSYLDDASINAEIDRIGAITDLNAAATQWGLLDERIMREQAPLVPLHYDRCLTLSGPDIGGVYLHKMLGLPTLQNAFVTSA
jgi:peptide/nickel transport system substrate-binding protein